MKFSTASFTFLFLYKQRRRVKGKLEYQKSANLAGEMANVNLKNQKFAHSFKVGETVSEALAIC